LGLLSTKQPLPTLSVDLVAALVGLLDLQTARRVFTSRFAERLPLVFKEGHQAKLVVTPPIEPSGLLPQRPDRETNNAAHTTYDVVYRIHPPLSRPALALAHASGDLAFGFERIARRHHTLRKIRYDRRNPARLLRESSLLVDQSLRH